MQHTMLVTASDSASGTSQRRASSRPFSGPLAMSVAIALGSGASGSVLAQQARDSAPLDEIEVIGQRLAITEAVRRKRDAANLKDVTASDDIGRLPDLNIGDALSRLPGVSTDQFEGEARFVNIRGLDSSLNNLTLDGLQLATGDDRGRDGRSSALDGISTSGIAAIEVVKTPTPDMDGSGIGGTINIITPSAFDRDGAFYGARFDTTYSNVSDTSALDWLSAELLGSNVFGANQQFGVFASVDFLRRDRLVRDRADNGRWVGVGDDFLPDRLDITRFPIKRERLNLNANFEYRPSDATELYVRVMYTNDQRTITNRVVEGWESRGAPTEFTDTGVLVPVRITLDGWEREQENETYSVTLGGGTDLANGFRIDYGISAARAESDRPLWVQNRFRTANFPGELFLDDGIRFEAVEPTFRNDPASFVLQRVRFDSINTKERLLTPKFDVTWRNGLLGEDGLLQAGVKATMRDKAVDARSDRFTPIETITLADNGFGISGPGTAGYAGGSWFQGRYNSGPAINNRAVIDFYNANPDLFTFSPTESIANNLEDDFDTDEDVYAGYLMAQIDRGPTLWTAGVRVEYTDYQSQASRVTFVDGDITSIDELSEGRTYTDVLPNLQVRHLLRDNLILRGAFTQSIGRPDYVAAAPIQSFEVDNFGVDEFGNPLFTASLSTGNPQLNRFQANNFDLSIEYYPSATGLLAAAVFYKDISNPIFNRREDVFDTSFGDFELVSLRIDTFENAESGRVSGLELTAQEQFSFLPGPLGNLGASLNYTIVDSKSRVIGRDDELPFFGQADRIANAAVFYQDAGFEARLAWRYRKEFLSSLGGNPDQDIYRDAYDQLDFKTSYRFANGLRIFADVWNLTNEQPRLFQGQKSRFWGLESTGRLYTVGLQWSL